VSNNKLWKLFKKYHWTEFFICRNGDFEHLAACRTHEINGQILKQMESTSAFSATKFLLADNFDSFVSLFG
jgi:hypothetical protein